MEPRESVKKTTRTRNELPKTTVWTQTTRWLSILIRRRRKWTSESQKSWYGEFWLSLGSTWSLPWDKNWRIRWRTWCFVGDLTHLGQGISIDFRIFVIFFSFFRFPWNPPRRLTRQQDTGHHPLLLHLCELSRDCMDEKLGTHPF